jgi:hypothetical protein
MIEKERISSFQQGVLEITGVPGSKTLCIPE